jgi:hypothetical protein
MSVYGVLLQVSAAKETKERQDGGSGNGGGRPCAANFRFSVDYGKEKCNGLCFPKEDNQGSILEQ